jgi:uncharacterized protein (UPF0305 family)
MQLSFPIKKTVDSVMSAFHTAISDLEAVQARELQQSRIKQEEAAAALTASENARKEAVRAQEVADKLKSLVGA